jgi:hypothetical protein
MLQAMLMSIMNKKSADEIAKLKTLLLLPFFARE